MKQTTMAFPAGRMTRTSSHQIILSMPPGRSIHAKF
jgi:hypothetical protein